MVDPEIEELSESLVDELVGAVGLPKNRLWHNLFRRVFQKTTDRLSSIGITFDHMVNQEGLPAGSEWALSHFCKPIKYQGLDNIPTGCPLLVVSNHPGAYDALIIFSKLVRKDIEWIGTAIPFLEKLPHVKAHIISATRTDPFNGMAVMRSSIRHLQSGGTLLYFGAGHRDPDPDVYPNAGKMMDNWLKGIEVFFKHIPGLILLPTVVSGVVSSKWSRHPLTLLRRKQIDKQRLSEFGQVITQLLMPGRLMIKPSISFGPPMTSSTLLASTGMKDLLPAVIECEKRLLISHCSVFGGDPGPMKQEEEIRRLSTQLGFDILNALGLPKAEDWYHRLKPFISKATDHFSRIALIFDKLISDSDISQAAGWSISNWCRGILARGCETVPRQGPLLIVSNHPGAYDALVITSCIPRPDLRLIASDLPVLRYLHNLSQRIFFIPMNKSDTYNRMAGLMSAIRHLKNGGAVLLMGSGTIEPDPAVAPGALQYIQRWTNAVNLFLHSVPDTQVILSAISHVLTPKWARHPITWLQNGSMEKRRIAEFGQVLQQLFFPGSLYASPRLSFFPAKLAENINSSPRDNLLEQESSLLIDHCSEFGGNPF